MQTATQPAPLCTRDTARRAPLHTARALCPHSARALCRAPRVRLSTRVARANCPRALARPLSAALPTLTQLRVRPLLRGTPQNFCVTVRGVAESTTVASLLEALAASPPALLPTVEGRATDELDLYFSPVFITPDVLLNRRSKQVLKPSQTLAEAQLVDDDIVYLVAAE